MGDVNGEPRSGEAGAGDDRDLVLQELEAKVKENWDMYLRARADFENYQKRIQRDLALMVRCGKQDLILRLLDIMDNLERALSTPSDRESLALGVDMILRQMQSVLSAEGVEQIQSVGAPFDPCLHDAVAGYEDSSVVCPTVTEELQKGYTYQGQVIRAARVRVASPVSGD